MKNDPLEHEERFHEKITKDSRKERKILSKKDRSKYKKTDLDKQVKKAPTEEGLEEGRVLAIFADGILVDSDDLLYTCSLRGALKKESQKIKNLIAVGDEVLFKPAEDLTGSIVFIKERRSILSRAEQISRKKEQLIAVNIDQVLITVSIGLPPLKPTLVDRYIIAALKGNMEPVIIVNKIDLLEEYPEEQDLFEEMGKIYTSLDIPFIPVSTISEEGIDLLRDRMRGKSSVFSGQSGTGKTSLINMLTQENYLTGKVIERTRKGSHTTTNTRLLPLEDHSFCVDTPGIKSFGIWDVKKEDLQEYFFEIAEVAKSCKFQSCAHMQEPDCAVKEALAEGRISRLRFDSYCALMAPETKR